MMNVGRADQAPGPWAIPRRERAPLSFYLGALLLVLALVFAVVNINDEPGRTDPATTYVPGSVDVPTPVTQDYVTEQEFEQRETRPAVCDAPSLRSLPDCQR